MRDPMPEGAAPRVSIIVCTHGDRLASFELLVAALGAQSMAFELVIVLGQVSDRLRAAVAALSGVARVVTCPEPNVSKARNTGIRAAGGDIIVFIDDDAVPGHREWLARLTAPLAAMARIAAAGGAVISGYTGVVEIYDGATSLTAFQRYAPGAPGERPPDGGEWYRRVPGGNSAFLSRALLDIGGFDEQYIYFLDEADVCVRLAAKGYEVVAVDDAPIHHFHGHSVHGGPPRLRSRHLMARSDAYFVMRHAPGGGWRRARAAFASLPAKGHFIEGGLLRQAGQISLTALARFRARSVIGFATGIWAACTAGPRLLDGAQASGGSLPWLPLPRDPAASRDPATPGDPMTPRAAVIVSAPSPRDAGDAMHVAAALYRHDYQASLFTSDDMSTSAPVPPGLEDAADVWAAACATARAVSAVGASAPAAGLSLPIAVVSIGDRLAARL
jgi:glycogen synthase